MTPLPGDFACVHTQGNVGTLITVAQYLNGTSADWWDHACIYVGRSDRNAAYGYVMGAQPGGARLDPLSLSQLTGDDKNWIWSAGHVKMTDAQRQAIVANALACKGVPYGWLDYLALAAHHFHLPIPGLKDYIGASKICSQLVDWCYMQAGVHLFRDDRWPGYVTPADLASLIGG